MEIGHVFAFLAEHEMPVHTIMDGIFCCSEQRVRSLLLLYGTSFRLYGATIVKMSPSTSNVLTLISSHSPAIAHPGQQAS
mmetsp:Transcript_24584/g.35108  ORF Transcript_24584/g.35108 Transcript_24584/m.35108 type:complete len:80 (+) Transcript_24584:258-497(+)